MPDAVINTILKGPFLHPCSLIVEREGGGRFPFGRVILASTRQLTLTLTLASVAPIGWIALPRPMLA